MDIAKSWRGIALTILLATAVAGTLDITDACVYWAVTKGVPPERIFQSVASGLLGKAAFKGGAQTAALGLALHFGIMAVMVAVYALASLRLPILTKRPVVMGLGYGLATYLVMNYVVLPLSRAGPRGSFVLPNFINGLMAHLVLVGLTVAMIVAWRERRTNTL
ncbi:MAG TPA: hypothetical protein VN158_04840 [Caulobacter sp.]|nr:hypothetical protein [Caulobacter sp.]